MSNQSKFFEKPLVELMPDEDSLKKLEFLATHSAYSLGFESTLRDAVDSLFIEYALDESFNSDEPWCVFAILSAIDGVLEGGPFQTDPALAERRSLYVRKVFRMVEPICKSSSTFGLGNWLTRISYSEGLTKESVAAWWDRSNPFCSLGEKVEAFSQEDPLKENERFLPQVVLNDLASSFDRSLDNIFAHVDEKAHS